MYNALELAKYIVTKCTNDKCPISNLQLQKILYYIQKSFLSNGHLAFSDDIEAWQFGPVVPNVYYHFCGYGAMPIDITYDTGISDSTIDKIIDEKRVLDPWVMVKETHKSGGAWNEIFNKRGAHSVIPVSLIKSKG